MMDESEFEKEGLGSEANLNEVAGNYCPNSKSETEINQRPETAYKYPPRTREAQEEARKVIESMEGVISKKSSPAVNVFTHQDGRISVGLSGNVASEKFQNNREKLQQVLDKKYGYGKYSVCDKTLGEEDGVAQIDGGNMPGACAEPKCAVSASEIDSPITGMSTQWRGKTANPHAYSGPDKDEIKEYISTEMNPCDTCSDKYNEKVYMKKAMKG
ncbi:hypothetical protein EUZ85_16095 [Hahella sp. KA22]|uniref:hypothetical protein n=1 Tax=Hahella sp. KA22 TaxID=1628392 RepID=UPI000FDE6FC6|nr:hypothetical protein [Hahella sp. KA22]AZZ92164.1 hypothetical protein ENC22_13530 [Hahella sp. KA22]QAY55535.1 hypothetical protein EUZ85_16095 [Hahella sp. KA22]